MSKSTIEGRRCDVGGMTCFDELVAKYGGYLAAYQAVVDGTLEKDFDPESVCKLHERFYVPATHKDLAMIALIEEVRDSLRVLTRKEGE